MSVLLRRASIRYSATSRSLVVALGLFVLLIAGGVKAPVVFAHTQGPFSAYTPIPPTIDGTLTYGNEWSNAYLVSFDLGGGYTGTLYIMNDGTSLYMGLEIVDNDLDAGDVFILVFDSDHDAVGREDGDHNMVVTGAGSAQDNFYQSGSLMSDTGGGGTVDVVGAVAAAGGSNYFEVSTPLNDADDAHDLNVGPGSTIGFMFQYNDANPGTLKQWPSDLPATNADLTISSAPSRPQLSGRAFSPVVIDGIVGADEWATAARVDFSIAVYQLTLYVMNDATDLYIAVKVNDATLTAPDRFTVQFDNNNDGLGRGTGDDQIAVGGDGTFQEAFYTSTGPGLSGLNVQADSSGGGTTDGLAAASNAAGFSYFEMKHPLNSADDAHDYSLNIGSHVGFFVVYQDAEGSASGYNRYWPSFQPSAMAEYTVADRIVPTIIVSFTPGTVDIGTGPPGTGTVTAALKDAAAHPVPGKVVTLSYGPTSTGPWTMFASGGTNSMGEYAATFNPPTTGTYYFMAEVTGDANINAGSATSAPNSMTVIPELPPPLVMLTLAVLLVVTITATRRRHRASVRASSG